MASDNINDQWRRDANKRIAELEAENAELKQTAEEMEDEWRELRQAAIQVLGTLKELGPTRFPLCIQLLTKTLERRQ